MFAKSYSGSIIAGYPTDSYRDKGRDIRRGRFAMSYMSSISRVSPVALDGLRDQYRPRQHLAQTFCHCGKKVAADAQVCPWCCEYLESSGAFAGCANYGGAKRYDVPFVRYNKYGSKEALCEQRAGEHTNGESGWYA